MTYEVKYAALSAVTMAAKMKRVPLLLSQQVAEKSEYKCAFERLTEIIAQLRAKFSSKYKVNNP